MDVPYGVQKYLQADSAVAGYVGTRVFLLELPEAEDVNMPRKCVIVKAGGGGATFGSGTLELNDLRINTLSYGETAHLAWNLDAAVYHALKTLIPGVWASTYIHWVKPLTRPMVLQDPDMQWPYVASSYQTLASDLTIT